MGDEQVRANRSLIWLSILYDRCRELEVVDHRLHELSGSINDYYLGNSSNKYSDLNRDKQVLQAKKARLLTNVRLTLDEVSEFRSFDNRVVVHYLTDEDATVTTLVEDLGVKQKLVVNVLRQAERYLSDDNEANIRNGELDWLKEYIKYI